MQENIRSSTPAETEQEDTMTDPIGHSITKRYRKTIWNPFIGAIRNYGLLNPGDHVAVCISGGKDSMLLAKCFQLLQKYSEYPFDVTYLAMDPGYHPDNRKKILENAEKLGLDLRLVESKIFQVVDKTPKSPCYLCARMRRGCLYKHAQEAGCNKIALGHHFDDVIETTLMSMFYGAEIRTMLPKLRSANYAGMELIRPLYNVRERDIIRWASSNELSFIRCACSVAERTEAGEDATRRDTVKRLIDGLCRENSNVANNIFHSMENVNLETVLGWKRGTERTTFLDVYNDFASNEEE
jgi:tRNA(Ile)-lysidine synthase TilS/MesJ